MHACTLCRRRCYRRRCSPHRRRRRRRRRRISARRCGKAAAGANTEEGRRVQRGRERRGDGWTAGAAGHPVHAACMYIFRRRRAAAAAPRLAAAVAGAHPCRSAAPAIPPSVATAERPYSSISGGLVALLSLYLPPSLPSSLQLCDNPLCHRHPTPPPQAGACLARAATRRRTSGRGRPLGAAGRGGRTAEGGAHTGGGCEARDCLAPCSGRQGSSRQTPLTQSTAMPLPADRVTAQTWRGRDSAARSAAGRGGRSALTCPASHSPRPVPTGPAMPRPASPRPVPAPSRPRHSPLCVDRAAAPPPVPRPRARGAPGRWRVAIPARFLQTPSLPWRACHASSLPPASPLPHTPRPCDGNISHAHRRWLYWGDQRRGFVCT